MRWPQGLTHKIWTSDAREGRIALLRLSWDEWPRNGVDCWRPVLPGVESSDARRPSEQASKTHPTWAPKHQLQVVSAGDDRKEAGANCGRVGVSCLLERLEKRRCWYSSTYIHIHKGIAQEQHGSMLGWTWRTPRPRGRPRATPSAWRPKGLRRSVECSGAEERGRKREMGLVT